ncbi:MAG TPA: hypothetical protein VNW06_00020, partial [Cytophagaceae bacterium]|nr:hypothetical protein [Cytophagaceae bacterium]
MKRKLLKIASIVLLLNVLTTTLAPTISYALTAGPTAPEYTSFEPVDTTDMVSLATGDFTYNIPLLEVPGPEGGYPLALSYHAGIAPDEEASWVGLGWSLNPGALNRSVQGFPDDVYNAPRTTHDYWPGGQTNTFTLGVGYAMFSVDVDIAHDTYRGTGVGVSLNAGYQIQEGAVALGVTASVSSGMYGQGSSIGVNAYAGVELSGNAQSGILGISAGINSNFKSTTAYAGIGLNVGNVSIVGADISSNNLKPSINVGGVSETFIQDNNAGKISSTSDGFRATIPLPYGFTLTIGQQFQRYWSDQRASLNMFGSLYTINSSGNTNTSSTDSYILPEFEGSNTSPEQQKGGSFLAYDMYSVLGQGIGGTIQPYTFQNST